MIFIWFWYGLRTERLFGGSSGLALKKERETARGHAFG